MAQGGHEAVRVGDTSPRRQGDGVARKTDKLERLLGDVLEVNQVIPLRMGKKTRDGRRGRSGPQKR